MALTGGAPDFAPPLPDDAILCVLRFLSGDAQDLLNATWLARDWRRVAVPVIWRCWVLDDKHDKRASFARCFA